VTSSAFLFSNACTKVFFTPISLFPFSPLECLTPFSSCFELLERFPALCLCSPYLLVTFHLAASGGSARFPPSQEHRFSVLVIPVPNRVSFASPDVSSSLVLRMKLPESRLGTAGFSSPAYSRASSPFFPIPFQTAFSWGCPPQLLPLLRIVLFPHSPSHFPLMSLFAALVGKATLFFGFASFV